MNRTRLGSPWLVIPVFALIGLLICVVPAYLLTGNAERFKAQTTVAMLPAANLPNADAPNYWEVLNRGQATRSAAIVLEDERWLGDASSAAGVPKSDLTLTAGAIPDTTLITVTVEANSARAAEAALQSVLDDALGQAAQVSGPFKLEVIASPAGTAQAKNPRPIELVGAFGVAGLLIGAGAGLLVTRAAQARSAQPTNGRRRPTHARGNGKTAQNVIAEAENPDSAPPR